MAAKVNNSTSYTVDTDKKTIAGGNGVDTIDSSIDTRFATGNWTISGGNGDDIVRAGAGDDIIWGDSTSNVDAKANGADKLYGGAGNDDIHGGNGADLIQGDNGADTLSGDKGGDTFNYVTDGNGDNGSAANSDGSWSATTGDTITDFTSSQGDKIDLGGITLTGDLPNGADQQLTWGNGSEAYDVWASNGFVYADTNGDGTADLAIKVNGTVGANDFKGINHDPVAYDNTNSLDEGGSVNGDLKNDGTPDTDSDGNTLHYSLDAPVAGLTLNDDGTYTFDASDDAYQHFADGVVTDVVADITVTDGHGGSTTQKLTLAVTGVNDAPVLAGEESVELNYAENGTGAIAAISATDIDDGDHVTLTLTGADADLFEIDGNGNLVFIASPDFEDPQDSDGDNAYEVSVVATDDFDATDQQDFKITVTDVNEGPPNQDPTDITFSLDTSSSSAARGGAIGSGTFIGTFAAVDADSSSWTYSVGGINGNLFAIDASTGLLQIAAKDAPYVGFIALATSTNYTIEITADDGAGGSYTETFTIRVGSNSGATGDNLTVLAGSDIDFALNNADTVSGGTGDDALAGGGGNDVLNGGAGNDELFGGDSNDHFVFTFYGDANADQVLDFYATNATSGAIASRGDVIELEDSVFTLLAPGALAAGNFAKNSGGNATDGNDYILFDTDTGNLYYDADGTGPGFAKQLIAHIEIVAGTFDQGDFLII